MTVSEIDTLVLKAIKAIESYDDLAFKPRIKTIVSFLKGAEKSPFYDYFISHKDICGKAILSSKAVEESCLRLIKRNLIKKHTKKGSVSFFETTEPSAFLKQCTRAEKIYIQDICNYIERKYSFIYLEEKKNRYAFYDSRIKNPNNIEYAWMWFTFKNMELIFRYKISSNDINKNNYADNQIIANEFHKQTIVNLIDLIVQNSLHF